MDLEKELNNSKDLNLKSQIPLSDRILLCFVQNFRKTTKVVFFFLCLFNIAYFSMQYYALLARIKQLEVLASTSVCHNQLRTSLAQTQHNQNDSKKQKIFYPFLYNEINKCKDENGSFVPVFLLIAIKSRSKDYKRREAVRRTWGNESLIPGVPIRRIFLLAKSKNENTLLVRLEAEEYNDIVLADFFDSFRNLTLKEIMFLRWVNFYCPTVKYIFKGDDDVFVNTFNIVEYLRSLSSKQSENLFTGSVVYPSPRISDPLSKYYVPKEVYQYRYYPPYVSGGGFLMSAKVGRKVFKVLNQVPLIPIDDAFMGVCLQFLEIKPQNHKGFKNWGAKYMAKSVMNFNCTLQEVMVWHKFTESELINTWRNVVKLRPYFTSLCTKVFTVTQVTEKVDLKRNVSSESNVPHSS